MLIATVTTQRSGSKLLASCFASGTQVRPYGEIFYPDRWLIGSYKAFSIAYASQMESLSGDQILDYYFGAFGREIAPKRAAHFDLMFNQLEMACTTWNPFESYFIYGYLKSRKAVVISLERDHRDIFASMKYLEQSQRPHVLKGQSRERPAPEKMKLDLDEYKRFVRSIDRHRKILCEAMQNYEFFIRLRYEDLAEHERIPTSVCGLIVAAGRAHGIEINSAFIQVHELRIQRTGVDYAEVFENFSALE